MTSAEKSRRRSSLGRGLSALLGDDDIPHDGDVTGMLGGGSALRRLAITDLEPNPHQPRRHFEDAALAELVASIRAKGLLQPILARPHPRQPNRYEIIAGERRWRAAQQAQLHDVPVIIRDFDDDAMLEAALIENIHRAALNPLEEAEACRRLIDTHGHSQESLGQLLGRSRSHIANTLRLLQLPEALQPMLTDGRISAGHARALLGLPEKEAVALAGQVVREGLNVRETERKAAKIRQAPDTAAVPAGGMHQPRNEADAEVSALARGLSAILGLAVDIRHGPDGRGQVTIRYSSLTQLDEVAGRLSRSS